MTTHTLTGDLGSLIGGELTSPNGTRAKAWVEPYNGAVTSGGDTLVGSSPLALDSVDAFSVVIPDGAYRVRVRYYDQAGRQMADYATGFFNFSTNSDLGDYVAAEAALFVPVRGVIYHATVSGATALDGIADHELNLTGNTQVTVTGPGEVGLLVHFNGFTLTVNGQAIVAPSDPGTVVAKLWAASWRIYVSASIDGGVVPSSPADIADLQLWYDASAASALTLVSSNVSNWRNDGLLGSGANDLTQATAGDRPTTTTINSLTAVFSADGTNSVNRLSYGSPINALPVTLWGVFRVDSLQDKTLMGGGGMGINIVADGIVRGWNSAPTSAGNRVDIAAGYAAGNNFFVCFREAADGTAKLWVGNVSNSGVITTAGGGLVHNFCQTFFGASEEHGAYSRALSDTEVAGLYAGLKTKWNCL